MTPPRCPLCDSHRMLPNHRHRGHPELPLWYCSEPGCRGERDATPEEAEVSQGHLSNEAFTEAERIADGAFPQRKAAA